MVVMRKFIAKKILNLYCAYLFKDKEVRKVKNRKLDLVVEMYYRGEISSMELSRNIKLNLGIR